MIDEGCVYFWTDSLIHGSLLGCILPMYAGGLPKRIDQDAHLSGHFSHWPSVSMYTATRDGCHLGSRVR